MNNRIRIESTSRRYIERLLKTYISGDQIASYREQSILALMSILKHCEHLHIESQVADMHYFQRDNRNDNHDPEHTFAKKDVVFLYNYITKTMICSHEPKIITGYVIDLEAPRDSMIEIWEMILYDNVLYSPVGETTTGVKRSFKNKADANEYLSDNDLFENYEINDCLDDEIVRKTREAVEYSNRGEFDSDYEVNMYALVVQKGSY